MAEFAIHGNAESQIYQGEPQRDDQVGTERAKEAEQDCGSQIQVSTNQFTVQM